MNGKKFAALMLVLVLLFSLGACSYGTDVPVTEEERSEEEILLSLLAGYNGFPEAPVHYTSEVSIQMAGTEIRLDADVILAGDNLSIASETEIAGVSVAQETVYADGMLYVSALDAKVKGAATADEARKVLETMTVSIPDSVGGFSKKTLLLSEDGSARIVFSEPTGDLLTLLKFSHILGTEGNSEEEPKEDVGEEETLPEEENSLRFTKIANAYLTLAFSSEGALTGMELGGDVTCLRDGVEDLLTLKVVYKILSTDPSEVKVTAPADGDSYTLAEDSGDEENSDDATDKE